MDNEGFRTEDLMDGIFGHGAILNILACDSEGRFYDIERERLTGLCRLADLGRTLQFLINGHIMPSVSVRGDEAALALRTVSGETLELRYVRFGEHHVLDSIILAGKEKKAYWVDAAKSRKEAWGIRLGVVAAGESGEKEVMEYLIGRPWAEEWLHSATAEMLD